MDFRNSECEKSDISTSLWQLCPISPLLCLGHEFAGLKRNFAIWRVMSPTNGSVWFVEVAPIEAKIYANVVNSLIYGLSTGHCIQHVGYWHLTSSFQGNNSRMHRR